MEGGVEGDALNTTVAADDNASNLTGRDAATTEGIIVTYSALFAMALGPILLGSLRSVPYHIGMKKNGQESVDRIKMHDAAMFPIYASMGLFGLYLFFKFLPKEYINLVLSVVFLMLGISALTRATSAILDPLLPTFITSRLTRYHLMLTVHPPNEDKEESDIWFNTADIILFIGSIATGAVYFFTKQWILNNLFGLAFSLNAVEMISLDSIKVGCLLLGGLFFYDIFWVFGTDVMVTVAKGLEAPIKLMFPMDLLEKGLLASNFGMLGLGDIVVPGLYIALLCRFDFHRTKGKSHLYFYTGFVAYILGLGLTMAVMHIFKAAQPALLYLVPCCVGLPFTVALFKGDTPALLKYVDYPEDLPKDEGGAGDREKEEVVSQDEGGAGDREKEEVVSQDKGGAGEEVVSQEAGDSKKTQ